MKQFIYDFACAVSKAEDIENLRKTLKEGHDFTTHVQTMSEKSHKDSIELKAHFDMEDRYLYFKANGLSIEDVMRAAQILDDSKAYAQGSFNLRYLKRTADQFFHAYNALPGHLQLVSLYLNKSYVSPIISHIHSPNLCS